MKNKHVGETCIIIGNGPSLNDIPIDFLQSYPSFGTNKIFLLENFEPTYYVSVNPAMINDILKNHAKKLNKLSCPKFIRHSYADKVKDSIPLNSAGYWVFSKNPLNFIFEGYTVTYVCMQLAFWMGFKNVLLLGVDHYFKTKGNPNEEVIHSGVDVNHFNEHYIHEGEAWNLPDLDSSERAYQMARRAYNKDGRQIYNLTTKTALDIFIKQDWHEWEQ